MKKFLVVILLASGVSVLRAAGVEVGGGVGGSIPYDGDHVSGSPSLQVSAFVKTCPFIAVGLVGGQEVNYVASKNGSGAPGTYADGLGYGSPHINVTNTNNNVTNILPPPTPAVSPAVPDARVRDLLFLEPTVRVGVPVGIFWPYLKASYGYDRITTQDGNRFGANAYSIGGGVQAFFGNYFAGLELSNRASESSSGVYRSVRANLSGGIKFGN